ncbi:CmcI family methyltransferase [Peribacillus sp. NPDC076916]|uniref:CmcI family methyltransferase n=1 Tax=Peribacillus sp. NPDC076916 TaxID=3390608 RepID=UPI003D03C8F2
MRQQLNSPSHARITYLEASSTAEETIGNVKSMINLTDTVMVILDSVHSKNHVLNELKLYGNFVTVGSYLILEDTKIIDQ